MKKQDLVLLIVKTAILGCKNHVLRMHIHSSLYDKLQKQDNLAWQELSAIILLADAEVNKGMIRQASYKRIKLW